MEPVGNASSFFLETKWQERCWRTGCGRYLEVEERDDLGLCTPCRVKLRDEQRASVTR